MKIRCMVTLVALALAGCEQEVVYRGSSIDRNFEQLNKQGWQVAGVNQPAKEGALNDPNVRVVKEADFSGYQFRTNFRVDDPKYQQPNEQANQNATPSNPQGTPVQGMNPWGAAPVAPGQ
jgi:hypothetical protein